MMDIKELMTDRVEVVASEATMQECARKMRDVDVGCIPVQEGGKVIGIVTDRDIVVRGIAEGLDAATTPITTVMTTDVVGCYEDEEVRDAAERMEQYQVRRLVVLNRDEQLVGILALGDMAVDTGNEALCGEVLERVSEPSQPAL